ncbi:hypothetical protein SAMN05216404_10235 [Nitrosospira multiformis]|uniref:Uncharacterized protein n=1 Tax=Nitrosospira multiformis TaxID=1231 RepID=A0A1H8CRD2_9PROT|nr:hypothetical protein SAMN05216404_10235 [Nitrosospira multiformis]
MVSKKNSVSLSTAIVLKAVLFAAEKHKNQRRKS